ncbi:MAG: phenylacetate--CoA ligase family protein, partial [Dehalococcoidia bacterium]|nr:phenylacetate--CoA ligase family protein [Dehalococcoidia bacterium]
MVDRNEYFDELEVMSPKAREEYYARKLQEQVKYAYEHAPSMRAKFDKAGISPSDIRTVRDLEKVPITRKDTLIDLRKTSPPFGGLLGVPREELEKVFMSPGPIYDFAPVDASFYRRFQRSFWAVGFRKGDMVVNCMSYHMVPAGHWIDRSLTTYGATVIPMGTGNTELQVKVLYDTKATGWIGICSFLMTILKKAEEMGYDPRRDFALRAAIPHAEVGGAEMRRIYEEEYGITSTDIYP